MFLRLFEVHVVRRSDSLQWERSKRCVGVGIHSSDFRDSIFSFLRDVLPCGFTGGADVWSRKLQKWCRPRIAVCERRRSRRGGAGGEAMPVARSQIQQNYIAPFATYFCRECVESVAQKSQHFLQQKADDKPHQCWL